MAARLHTPLVDALDNLRAVGLLRVGYSEGVFLGPEAVRELASRCMNSFRLLKTQILAGLSVPLGEERRTGVERSEWLFDEARFEENPGRVGRNGLGSLEVGGGEDWFDC